MGVTKDVVEAESESSPHATSSDIAMHKPTTKRTGFLKGNLGAETKQKMPTGIVRETGNRTCAPCVVTV